MLDWWGWGAVVLGCNDDEQHRRRRCCPVEGDGWNVENECEYVQYFHIIPLGWAVRMGERGCRLWWRVWSFTKWALHVSSFQPPPLHHHHSPLHKRARSVLYSLLIKWRVYPTNPVCSSSTAPWCGSMTGFVFAVVWICRTWLSFVHHSFTRMCVQNVPEMMYILKYIHTHMWIIFICICVT